MPTPPSRPMVCAHRGASGHAPENTLAALELAIDLGANMAEIDIQLTADDQLVLCHDDRLERTTDGRGVLTEQTLAELKRLDAGSWFGAEFAGEPMATLDEALTTARGRIDLNIELKATRPGVELAEIAARTVVAADFADHCVVTSFDRDLIDGLATGYPQLRVGYILMRRWFKFAAELYDAPVHLLSVEHRGVNRDVVDRTHAADKEIHVWTGNEEKVMRRMVALGVDGIITNYPERLLRVLGER